MNCAIEFDSTVEELSMAGITAAVLEERVNNHVKFFWTVVAFLVGWLGIGTWMLVDVRSDVKILMLPQKLAASAIKPTDPYSQSQATKIIADAKKHAISLPQSVVEEAGVSFANASADNPGAWNVALELVNYRSSLNPAPDPSKKYIAWSGPINYSGWSVPGKPAPETLVSTEGTSAEDMALLEHLGEPSNPNVTNGPAALLLRGGTMVIDKLNMRHVILENVTIYYEGNPIRLIDVRFAKCTFVITKNEEGRKFAKALLATGMKLNYPNPTQI